MKTKQSKPLAFAVIALALSSMACLFQVPTGATLSGAVPTQTPTLISSVKSVPTQRVVTVSGDWNVRACAGIECAVIAYALDGETLTVGSVSDGWIYSDDVAGWVRSACCE